MIKYLCFLTFFIIISCSIFENEKFIPKKKLVNILIEMHVLEASIDNLNLSKDLLNHQILQYNFFFFF